MPRVRCLASIGMSNVCLRSTVWTIPAAEQSVDDALSTLRSADDVEWVSSAADEYRAALVEAIGRVTHLRQVLAAAFPAVDALHVAVGETPSGSGLWDWLPGSFQ